MISTRLYTVDELPALLGIGRTTAYRLANSGEIGAIRIRKHIRIPAAALARWAREIGYVELAEHVEQEIGSGVPAATAEPRAHTTPAQNDEHRSVPGATTV